MSPSTKALAVLSLLVLSFALLAPAVGVAQRPRATQEEPERELVVVELQAVNVDGQPLEGALVEAYNKSVLREKLLNSSTTNSTGWARLWVENGSICVFKVFWKDALVGVLDNVTVTANMTMAEPIVCSVCDLVIGVVDAETGALLPNINVKVSGNYTDRHGKQAEFSAQELTTNLTGLCSLENVLMNCTYLLKAYRHEVLFNETVIGPLNGTTALNITCPRYLVKACVVDERFRPIRGAVVEAYDWGTGELLASERVDAQGLVEFWALPGRCMLRALLGQEVLLEVPILVDKNETWWPLVCVVHNFSLTVLVLDAWGNPLPGLEVRLLINDTVVAVATTPANGTVVFTGLRSYMVEVVVLSGDEVLAMRWIDVRTRRSLVVVVGDRVRAFGGLVRVLDLIAYSSMGSVLTALAIIVLVWTRLSRRKTL